MEKTKFKHNQEYYKVMVSYFLSHEDMQKLSVAVRPYVDKLATDGPYYYVNKGDVRDELVSKTKKAYIEIESFLEANLQIFSVDKLYNIMRRHNLLEIIGKDIFYKVLRKLACQGKIKAIYTKRGNASDLVEYCSFNVDSNKENILVLKRRIGEKRLHQGLESFNYPVCDINNRVNAQFTSIYWDKVTCKECLKLKEIYIQK